MIHLLQIQNQTNVNEQLTTLFTILGLMMVVSFIFLGVIIAKTIKYERSQSKWRKSLKVGDVASLHSGLSGIVTKIVGEGKDRKCTLSIEKDIPIDCLDSPDIKNPILRNE